MTSHLDSHTTTDVMSGVQTGNGIPHERYDIRLLAYGHANQKDVIFMQRELGQIFTYIFNWGQGICKRSRPYPARAYTIVVLVIC